MPQPKDTGLLNGYKIKTTKDITSHLTMAIINKQTNKQRTNVGKDTEKITLSDCWWECKLMQSLGKLGGFLIGRFLFQKIKIELPYYPAIPLLGIYTKELKSKFQRDIYTPMCVAALFTTPKT